MTRKIIIGSRGSDLALWQANHIQDKLKKLGLISEIKIIKTKGDKIQNLSFDKIEGKGFFTKEIEEALIDKSIDLAVHSHKDLETDPPKGLVIAAVSIREDPSELLLMKKEDVDPSQLWALKKNAIIGTSSSRRKSQLNLFRSDLNYKDLRGNVPTRIEKMRKGEYDAVLLAKAGVTRLNLLLDDLHVEVLPRKWFIPAPAQGVLGLQIREEDEYLIEKLNAINSKETQREIKIERKVLNLLKGGCQLPLGVLCEYEGNIPKVWASLASSSNKVPKRIYLENSSPEEVVDKIIKSEAIKSRVFITRDLNDDSIFLKVLQSNGYIIEGKSLIRINYLPIDKIESSDWVFFTSSNAVLSFKSEFNKIKERKIGAISSATARQIKTLGFNVDFTGVGKTETIAKDFADLINDQSVLFPISDISLKTIQGALNLNQIKELVSYTTSNRFYRVKDYDVIVFTSPSNVNSFFDANSLKKQTVIALGDSTYKALINKGIKQVYKSWESSELALADMVMSI